MFVHLLTRSSSECTDLCKTGTHSKNKAPLLGTILFIKVEGVLTEYYLRIRIYFSLERIRNILRYRLKMNMDPDLHFSSFRIRISMTVHAQFYIILFINLFSANFYLFFAGFLQEKLRFFTKNSH